jgi:hypothetical protein
MQLTIDIRPEFEAALTREAAVSGRRVEVYAANLVEQAVLAPPPVFQKPVRTLREVFQSVQGLTEDLDFSRASDTGRPVDLS